MKKWVIGWGVVSSCNMNCKFCYSRSKRNEQKDIDPKYWYSFIDKNADLIESINYGTGENSISNDWWNLIDYIRTNHSNIVQSVTTNGYISEVVKRDERKKDIFLRSIDEVDVSLDYAKEDEHNSFRGQKKAYNWAMNMLKLCHENNKRLTIVSLGSDLVVTKENMEGLFDIAEKYGAMLRMNIYRPTNGIDDFSKQFMLSKERLVDFLKWVNDNYGILALDDALLSAIILGKKNSDPSGVNSLRILPNGDITPSTYLIHDDFIVGNLKDDVDLNEIKRLKDNKLDRIVENVIPEECKSCKYVSMCKGGVVDRRYLWNGNLNKRDPYCFADNPVLMHKLENITLINEKFESVHDGYLPTMFFKSKRKVK